MNKAFNGKLFENYPSVNTPLGESMLNPIVVGLNEVDDRVVRHDTTKANQSDMYTAITDVSLDEDTGIFTFTRHNGTTITLNTALEKVIMNWRYDNRTQTLYLIMQDGSELSVDLSAFITNVDFRESSTIRPYIGPSGEVSFNIIDGSITGEKLEPNYLANVQLYSSQALSSASNAKTSEENAKTSEEKAKEYMEQAQQTDIASLVNGTTPVGDSNKLGGKGASEYALGTDLANYLPKTGGKLSKADQNLLELENTASDVVRMRFSGLSGNLGYLGVNGVGNFVAVSSKDWKENTLLHTGNKPTGSYTGNGSAEKRTIAINAPLGEGDALLLDSEYGLCIVTMYRTICFRGTTVSTISGAESAFYGTNFVMYTANEFINASGRTYYWRVL